MIDESIDLDLSHPTTNFAGPTKKKSHRMLIAVFFLGLNFLILMIWMAWPSGDAGASAHRTLDNAAPFQEIAKPRKPLKPAPPIDVSDDAPAHVKEESRKYEQARLKLQAAKRWQPTHPNDARKLAREAIKLAPDTDVAMEAQELLSLLK